MDINSVTIFALLASALWTVMSRSLLRSAIGLALVSILLTILMFRLHSPLAAVFELSVCAGLISVLFVSTISLTQSLTQEEVITHMRQRMARFWYLPFVLIVLAAIVWSLHVKPVVHLPAPEKVQDVRVVLWHLRQIDMVGQIIVLLAGTFGVIMFFKERVKK